MRRWLDEASRSAGFSVVGVAQVGGPDDPAAAQQAARFSAWIDAGHAGQMDYLKRRDESGTLIRSSPRVAMPWARSAIVCAMNYNSAIPFVRSEDQLAQPQRAVAPRSIDPAPPGAGWIARYAWTGRPLNDGSTIIPTDYHDELLTRLRTIETALLARATCTTRCYVDTGPLVERTLAAGAGIGWIGKNTCLINQQLGSWLLLAVLVTSLPVEDEFAAPDRCGSCTRCIDACPTGALLGSKQPGAPRQMDASRCIAYLTIEKKGSIAEDLRAPMGRNVFGCDICQDVCPWNVRAPIASASPLAARRELINPAVEWLASLEGPEFAHVFRGSPVERRRRDTSRRKRFRRNVAIAMGNSGEASFLPRLDAWAAGGDPVLAEAAAWAAARLRGSAQ